MKERGKYRGVTGDWFNGQERFVATPWGWNKIRLMVRSRANDSCEQCGAYTVDGHTHHLNPRKMGGGFRDDRLHNLAYLCDNCHHREHNQ